MTLQLDNVTLTYPDGDSRLVAVAGGFQTLVGAWTQDLALARGRVHDACELLANAQERLECALQGVYPHERDAERRSELVR